MHLCRRVRHHMDWKKQKYASSLFNNFLVLNNSSQSPRKWFTWLKTVELQIIWRKYISALRPIRVQTYLSLCCLWNLIILKIGKLPFLNDILSLSTGEYRQSSIYDCNWAHDYGHELLQSKSRYHMIGLNFDQWSLRDSVEIRKQLRRLHIATTWLQAATNCKFKPVAKHLTYDLVTAEVVWLYELKS